ncbi:hypothetical protein QFZ94_002055 [Paraburkholderia sp. JPY465]
MNRTDDEAVTIGGYGMRTERSPLGERPLSPNCVPRASVKFWSNAVNLTVGFLAQFRTAPGELYAFNLVQRQPSFANLGLAPAAL